MTLVRALFILLVILCGVTAITIRDGRKTPLYTSRANLQITSDKGRDTVPFVDVTEERLWLERHIRRLTSDKMMAALAEHPEIKKRLLLESLNADAPPGLTIVDRLKAGLRLSLDKDLLIHLGMTDPNPELAFAVASLLPRLYQAELAHKTPPLLPVVRELGTSADFGEIVLTTLGTKALDQPKIELTSFHIDNGSPSYERRRQGLRAEEDARERHELDARIGELTAMLHARHKRVPAALHSDSLLRLSTDLAEKRLELQVLRHKHGAKHPNVVKKAGEVGALILGFNRGLKSALRNLITIRDNLVFKQEREETETVQAFDTLLLAMDEVPLSETFFEERLSVVTSPLPASLSAPRRIRNLGIAIGAGLILGLILFPGRRRASRLAWTEIPALAPAGPGPP